METAAQAEELVRLLKEREFGIATAESCTGGLAASSIVDVAGASDVFGYGFVTYANEAKEKLVGVRSETLLAHGAVSPETAAEMARGACESAGCEVGISTTGIAGPSGGTADKPVGLVYIGACICGEVFVEKCLFSGTRRQIREQAAKEAISFVIGRLTA